MILHKEFVNTALRFKKKIALCDQATNTEHTYEKMLITALILKLPLSIRPNIPTAILTPPCQFDWKKPWRQKVFSAAGQLKTFALKEITTLPPTVFQFPRSTAPKDLIMPVYSCSAWIHSNPEDGPRNKSKRLFTSQYRGHATSYSFPMFMKAIPLKDLNPVYKNCRKKIRFDPM